MDEMVRSVVRTVWSDGGQRVARRNAWAAMAADAQRARQRREVATFMSTVADVPEWAEAATASAHA